MIRKPTKEENGWKIWEIENSSRVTKIEFQLTRQKGAILRAGELILTFKTSGARYIYHNVPEVLVLNAVSAESVGKGLNPIIHNKRIKYEKLEA